MALQLLSASAWRCCSTPAAAIFEAVRTAFLIPMVLPPIVAALIWKIIYTPDVSPLHRLLAFVGLPLGSLITNADTALWAIAVADTWQWFPFTMLMMLAALQMIPDEPLEAARIDGAGQLAALPLHHPALHPPGAAWSPACSG